MDDSRILADLRRDVLGELLGLSAGLAMAGNPDAEDDEGDEIEDAETRLAQCSRSVDDENAHN